MQGELNVVQFDLLRCEGSRYYFAEQTRVRAAVGDAGCLIPPYEYHVLGNALPSEVTVTLHVYGGEMARCSVFEPQADGTFLRHGKSLSYHD